MTTSLTCPRCGRTTFHPVDLREGYCGSCKDWTSQPSPDWPSPSFEDTTTLAHSQRLRPRLVNSDGVTAYCARCGALMWLDLDGEVALGCEHLAAPK